MKTESSSYIAFNTTYSYSTPVEDVNVAEGHPPPVLMTLAIFEPGTVDGMKEKLRELHKSGHWGKVKRAGNESALMSDEYDDDAEEMAGVDTEALDCMRDRSHPCSAPTGRDATLAGKAVQVDIQLTDVDDGTLPAED
ncbi:hypothetical protein J1614_006933 [Plenodomus biglobosus]|nr:hypothetical protein J1614_006933 [Plenodomus biglobosus]